MVESDIGQVQNLARAPAAAVNVAAAGGDERVAAHSAAEMSSSVRPSDGVELSAQARQHLMDSVLRVAARALTSQPSSERAAPQAALSSEAVGLALSDDALRVDLARLLSRPETLSRLPELPRDPAVQELTVRVLAQPEMAAVARQVFVGVSGGASPSSSTPASQPPAPAPPPALPAAAPTAQQILARPDVQKQLLLMLQKPAGQEALRSLLERPDMLQTLEALVLAAERSASARAANSPAATRAADPAPGALRADAPIAPLHTTLSTSIWPPYSLGSTSPRPPPKPRKQPRKTNNKMN